MRKPGYIITLIVVLIILHYSPAHGDKRLHKEREYQEKWCNEVGGIMEYVLPDGTRVDCLTDEYAIEFDFADKWAEAIGQSLHYAQMSGKKPGVVLILERESDNKHVTKLERIASRRGIKTWLTNPSFLQNYP